MRSFLAIDFERNIKAKLADIQSDFRKLAVSGRWKYIDNFHLTLKFLGEVDPGMIKDIDQRLISICSSFKQFQLKFSHVGYFPGKDNIRILWLGLTGDLVMLKTLQQQIDKQMGGLGFKEEKRDYIPHITIGQDIIFRDEFENIRNMVNIDDIPAINVKDVYFFKSEQINGKRIYTPISRYSFGK